MQIRLIYASTVSPNLKEGEISAIFATARKFNSEHKITGMLCHNEKYFFQYIEGIKAEIDALYENIKNDSRHSNIVLLDYSETNIRLFREWSMADVDANDEDIAFIIKKYSSHGFNPYKLSASNAADFIEIIGTFLKGKTQAA